MDASITSDADCGHDQFNAKQVRFRDFAVRKSLHWSGAESIGSGILVLTSPRSSRQLVLYRSGRIKTGLKVALIDPSGPIGSGLRWITQRDAWSLIAENGL